MIRTRRVAAAGVAVAMMVGACSGGDADTVRAASAEGGRTASTTTAPVRVPATLTGLPVAPDALDRAAVSIKVDNSPQGRPQAGLELADVIFEEKVEGGVTRFIAVYHSRDADLVGPIRSLRTSDPAIVSAVGGVFVFSDGVAKSLSRLRGAPVSTVSEREGAGPFTYPRGKTRPWATFGATTELRSAGGSKASKPQPLFAFLADQEVFGNGTAVPAAKALVNFGGRTTATVEWDADAGRWLRSTNGASHTLSDGSRLSFTNVIIQKTPYRNVGYNDSAGNKVDEAMVVGTGDAIILSGGLQVKARWSKASASAPTEYTDVNGVPVKLQSGTTLVVLPPTGNSVTVT